MRMMAARAHRHTMLRDVKMRVVSRTAARLARAVDPVGGRTARDNDVLAVLERRRGIRAHDVAQIRRHVRCAHLRVGHHAVDHAGIASGIHVVLAALIAAIGIAWMVRMIRGRRNHASVRACAGDRRGAALAVVARGVLLSLRVAARVIGSSVASIAAV